MPDTPPQELPVAWHPDPESIAQLNLSRFMRKHGIASLDDLQRKSVADIEWFWDAVLKDLGIRFRKPYSSVVEVGDNPAFAEWCVGGRMNIVDSLLDRWVEDERSSDTTAIIWEGEAGQTRSLTYRELNEEVSKCANALRALGAQRGEAIGLYMPMSIEIVVAFLATVKLGCVVLPLFSGYGPEAVATRLADADAKILFAANGFLRRGKPVNMKQVADVALDGTNVRTVVVVSHIELDVPLKTGRDVRWEDVVPRASAEAATVDTAADDVLMIIYTSGTTGRPKGAVHTHCGFPVKAAQDMFHAMDVRPGDVMYWMSDMGWMMGPWLVFGTLAIGATMVVYDGAPDYPSAGRTWESCEKHGVTHLGLSPVLVRALKQHGPEPVHGADLSSLRAVCSTGSPWDPESWLWLFENVLGRSKPILNYSGGTEISGGILCGNFFRPLKPCSFSGPVPGMDVDVVDESGASVRGLVGELIIRQPWIGMTRGFWNDEQRYLDSYWRKLPGVWLHGDFALVDDDTLWYVLGRSDDTIKVAGKRLGPAEVEAVANAVEGVAESAAIGVPDEMKGEALVVYCVPQATPEDAEHIRSTVSDRVADALGKPLRPREVFFTASLPKTRNAKIMRRLIRAVHLREDLGNVTALERESSLDDIRSAY